MITFTISYKNLKNTLSSTAIESFDSMTIDAKDAADAIQAFKMARPNAEVISVMASSTQTVISPGFSPSYNWRDHLTCHAADASCGDEVSHAIDGACDGIPFKNASCGTKY